MALNVEEVVKRIKNAGMHNTRIVPAKGQSIIDGQHQIEINENGQWAVMVTGIKRKMAEDIVAQAANRLICG